MENIKEATGLGLLLGTMLGGITAMKKNKEMLDGWRGEKGNRKDAKKLFATMKSVAPGTVLMTRTDLQKAIDKEKTIDKIQVLQSLRDGLEYGNALALHPAMVPLFMKKHLPSLLHDKRMIFSADKVDPSVIAHEIGHIVDFDELIKKPFWKRFYEKHLRSSLAAEEAAWNKAPGKIDEKKKTEALDSYRRARNFPLIGAVAGGIVDVATIALMAKHRNKANEAAIRRLDQHMKDAFRW
jgi:hypothetical protein